jgi:hypothetical protein
MLDSVAESGKGYILEKNVERVSQSKNDAMVCLSAAGPSACHAL